MRSRGVSSTDFQADRRRFREPNEFPRTLHEPFELSKGSLFPKQPRMNPRYSSARGLCQTMNSSRGPWTDCNYSPCMSTPCTTLHRGWLFRWVDSSPRLGRLKTCHVPGGIPDRPWRLGHTSRMSSVGYTFGLRVLTAHAAHSGLRDIPGWEEALPPGLSLLGRPVNTGQRVLQRAAPRKPESFLAG